jgi:signal transduction histidine kinase
MDMPTASLSELENLDEAVAIYDSRDRLSAFNHRYQEWRGAIGGDVRIGVPWLNLVTESVRCGAIPEARGREQQWLEQRRKVRGYYSIVRKTRDGRSFKVSERRTPTGGIAVIWTDISELIGALESRVREIEGDQGRLLTLGKRVAEVAHDFNNALQGVVASLDILSKTMAGGNERSLRLLSNATLSARHGMAIAERLLARTRRPQLPNPIDLGAKLQNFLPVLRGALHERVELHVVARPGSFLAHIDPVKLEAAVLNLVLNARDAIDGAGKVIVSLHHDPMEGTSSGEGFVVLTVTDTGRGMDYATLARATESLFTTKKAGKGTGLGLSAVKQFSEAAGGKLMLHSSLGIGTSVEMWLPAVAVIGGAS